MVIGSLFSSCDKDADPETIKVSSTPVSGGGTINPGGGTTNPGGGTTNPGGGTTNPGGGTTNPGGGTTNPGGGTTNPGTVNSSGDGGVGIGAEGTIIFTLKGTTYTLTNSPNYLVNGVSASLGGFGLATINGVAANGQGIQFIMGSMADKAGVDDALTVNITLANGTSYTAAEGKINYTTFSVNQNKLTSKGTFDLIVINDADANDKIKVGGSFNVK